MPFLKNKNLLVHGLSTKERRGQNMKEEEIHPIDERKTQIRYVTSAMLLTL